MATAVHYELIKLACSRPDELKVLFEQVWTLERLAKALKFETGVGLSRTEIWRVLQGAGIRPHRVRRWLHSPDPDFRPKIEAICKLYLEPPQAPPCSGRCQRRRVRARGRPGSTTTAPVSQLPVLGAPRAAAPRWNTATLEGTGDPSGLVPRARWLSPCR